LRWVPGQIGCLLPERVLLRLRILTSLRCQDFPARHSLICREAIESRNSRMAPRRNV